MRTREHLYFVGPFLDAFFMGGLSIVVFAYYEFFYRGYSSLQVSDTAMALAAFFNWVVNYPHFAATSYRFYQSPDHRREFPLTAVLVPVLILLGTIACFVWPREFAPAWTKIYVLWSVYHYSGQNLGLSLIYARRAGIDVGRWWRLALAGFLYACFVAQYAEVEAKGGTIWVFAIEFPLVQIPQWFAVAARWLANGLGVLVLGFAARWMWRAGRGIPLIVAVPVAAQYVWTSLGAATFSFQMLVPFFHGLQYLFVAWAMEMHRRSGEAAFGWRAVGERTLAWAGLCLSGGGLLFYGLPWIVSRFGYELSFPLGVFFVSVQIHHFFVDGVIWKLRAETERSPLFKNVRAFWRLA